MHDDKDISEGDISQFGPAEDKLCALGLFKYGYGYWDLIRNDLRNSHELTFNWIARSRTVADIQKRCEQIILGFKREYLPDSLVDEKKVTLKEQKLAKEKKEKPQSATTKSRGAKKKPMDEDDDDFMEPTNPPMLGKRKRDNKSSANEPNSAKLDSNKPELGKPDSGDSEHNSGKSENGKSGDRKPEDERSEGNNESNSRRSMRVRVKM